MSTEVRILWLVAMALFIGGCSTYKVASSPFIEEEMGVTNDLGHPVKADLGGAAKAGDEVRITLTDGSKVEGWIQTTSPAMLTVTSGSSGRFNANENDFTTIRKDQIRVIEIRKGSTGGTIGLLTAIVVVVFVVGVATAGISINFGS